MKMKMNTAKISLSFFVVYHFVCAEQHCCNFSGMFRIKIKASFLVWSNFKIGWKQKKNTEIFVIQWDACEKLKWKHFNCFIIHCKFYAPDRTF